MKIVFHCSRLWQYAWSYKECLEKFTEAKGMTHYHYLFYSIISSNCCTYNTPSLIRTFLCINTGLYYTLFVPLIIIMTFLKNIKRIRQVTIKLVKWQVVKIWAVDSFPTTLLLVVVHFHISWNTIINTNHESTQYIIELRGYYNNY